MAAQCTLAGRGILVVEDEFLIACTIGDHLEHAGATVIGPAVSVAEALVLLDGTTTVDAAVLDIGLRDEKVFPVAAVLRERSIPFIFATGYTSIAAFSDYKDVPFLEKPINHRDLIAVLSASIALNVSLCLRQTCNLMAAAAIGRPSRGHPVEADAFAPPA
jgi:DNA-binding response OmpR family regulator